MAVSEQTPYIEYTANGSTTSFALGFICDSKNDLIVLVDNVAPPVATWSLVGNNAVFTTAPASGKKIVLQRNTAMSRTTNYQSNNNSFRPETINKDIDRVWLKLQELGVADFLLSLKLNKEILDRIQSDIHYYTTTKRETNAKLEDLKSYIDQLINGVTGESFLPIRDTFVQTVYGTQEQVNEDIFNIIKAKQEKWIVCSDTQPIGQLQYDNMGLMFKHMTDRHPDAVLGVLNGDMVDHPTENNTGTVYEFGFDAFIRSLQTNSHIPFNNWLFIAGNHDRDGVGAGAWEDAWTLKSYRKFFGREFYYTIRGNVATVHISDMGGQNSGEILEHVIDWLEAVMSRLKSYNIIINMHQCLAGVYGANYDNLQIQSAELQAIIEAHDNIAAVFWGHNATSAEVVRVFGTTFVNTNIVTRDSLTDWKYVTLELVNNKSEIIIKRHNVGLDTVYDEFAVSTKYPIKVHGGFDFDGRHSADQLHTIASDRLVVYRSYGERRVLNGDTWSGLPSVQYPLDIIVGDDSNDGISSGVGTGVRFGVAGGSGVDHGGDYLDYLSPCYGWGAAVSAVRLNGTQTSYYSKLSIETCMPTLNELREIAHFKFGINADGSGSGAGLFVNGAPSAAILAGYGAENLPTYADYSVSYSALLANGQARMVAATSTTGMFTMRKGFSGGTDAFRFIHQDTQVGSIVFTDTATAYNTTSDETLKNFEGELSYEDAISVIKADPTRRFNWKVNGEKAVGWGAQTSYAVSQDLATKGGWFLEDGTEVEPETEGAMYLPWAIDQSKRTPYLWAAVAGLYKEVQELKAELENLKNQST